MIARVFLVTLLFAATAFAADNWPDYRGPHRNGHVDAPQLPVEWSESNNITWKTPIHGRGHSTPVIWGNQIWLTTATEDGKKQYAMCVDKSTGEIIHDILLWENEKPQFAHKLNSQASPSPSIEDGHVFVHFGTYGTACINTQTGKVVWQRRDINIEHFMGPGSTPIIYEDLLICHMDGADQQFVIALNKETGDTVWKTPRTVDYEAEGVVPDLQKAYSTPFITKKDGKDEMISVYAQGVSGYDPRTGKEKWKLRFNGFSNVSRPIVGHGLAYINTGFNRGQLWAVKLDDCEGDVPHSAVAWKADRNIGEKPTAILVDDLLYNLYDGGIVTCMDAKTGEEVWKFRISGNYSSSPIHANGRLYFFSQEGKSTVMKVGREPVVLAVSELDEGIMAGAAVTGNTLFIRTLTHLYRIEEK